MKPAALETRALTQQLLGIMEGLTVRGAGVDVISIARVEQALKRHGDRFAARVLSAREWERYARMEAAGIPSNSGQFRGRLRPFSPSGWLLRSISL